MGPVRGEIRIRAYTDADLDAVLSVFQRAVREVASRDYGAAQIAAWSTADRVDWRDWRLPRPTWIAEIDGRIAGFSDLEDNGHLDMMFVHPDLQGRGIASALLAHVETTARQQGMRRIFTEASLTSRPFFTRRGFITIAEQTVLADGVPLANTRMEKWLS